MELNKYFVGEVQELSRSQIKFADYNPRFITDDGKRSLKRGIKKFGMLGGLVINKQTGNTVVQGHQRIESLDALNKYDPETKENDYVLRAEVIDVTLAEEMEINVLLNNPNAQGQWDYDALRELVANKDFDYKAAELTDADLSMIGVDNIFQTEGEKDLMGEFDDLLFEQKEDNERQKAERAAEREIIRQAQQEAQEMQENADISEEERQAELAAQAAMERQAKIDHMKEVKKDVINGAVEKAKDMDAYLMISFTTFENKAMFCEKMGYDPYTKFIKGEEFDSRIEIEDDEEEMP